VITNDIAVHVQLIAFIKSVITKLTARAQITLAGIDHVRFFIGAVVKLDISERLPGYEHAPQADHVGLSNAWGRLKAVKKCIVSNPSASHPKRTLTNFVPTTDNMKTRLLVLGDEFRYGVSGKLLIAVHPKKAIGVCL
jgi:hypothetical protein